MEPQSKVLTVERLAYNDMYVEGEIKTCAVCGEDFEDLDVEYVWEPNEWISPHAIVPVHTWCAVQNGYELNWSEARRGV